ncbi:hypothetical protein [Actinoplanes xinjiangensis]|uniref:Uncharacterized protein n=1 Tax=Actinoplanes xinjiangensis TaxID=512350 RepID=A0A316EQF8_9ACTN|nr:hypothetical protein [Actinoplanes xinjiangensis]PWK33233.1 hypothetical protein BC793_12823 [Actinoplanes xinjiangensis]GIF43528.1 hypothetical protein Axi01nite_78390 [Actinoplanes xinjiangensis]
MTEAYLDELVRRLRAGEDPRRLQQSLLPEATRETLRRCAVARTFDPEIYGQWLSVPAGPGLDELVEDGFAEPLPGPDALYRLPEGIRTAWLADWPTGAGREASAGAGREVPAGVAELSGLLAKAHAARGDGVEQLYHLALSDPEAAAVRFKQLFQEADARFDLAACLDVLDTLGEPGRQRWLSPELGALHLDRRTYLRARSFWATEWRQSARYLERRGPNRQLERLIDDGDHRILQLHARGGSGKTMLVRWFIARWCVPEPRRIPCARIDFDLVDVAEAAQRPWLLLLDVADQLNRQIPGTPFQELLNDRGVLRALLDPRRSPGVVGASAQLEGEPEQVAREVTERFVRTLAETSGERPVLLAFDTFERMLLDRDGQPAPLMHLLAQVRDRCPAVRLLVAGRYDLRGRMPWLPDVLPGLRTATVDRFTAGEARRYLHDRRGITAHDLADAMLTKSNGDPFVLALLADLAQDRAGLTAEQVLAYDDPQVLYLVERIISRIGDPTVRWLLRYAVVPRRLTREFVAEVMAPFLRSGMSGTSTVDDPGADGLPGPDSGQLFRTDVLDGPDEPWNPDAVWRQLLQYAAGSSWVSLRHDDHGVVQFHPDLVIPMRQVLRRHPVYLALHRAAARYYEWKSEQQRENRVSWLLEMIYHRFQAGAADAADGWRQALRLAEDELGLEAWDRIAGEVLGPDYVDENGTPLPFHGRLPLVTWEVVAEAHVERARLALARAAQLPGGPAHLLAGRALASLQQAAAIRERHRLRVPDEAATRLLFATGERLRANADAAYQGAMQALTEATDPADRAAVTEVLADIRRPESLGEAARLYNQALEVLTGFDRVAAVRVRRKLVQTLAEQGRLQPAEEQLQVLPRPDLDAESGALVLIDDGRVWLRAGRPAELLHRIALFPAGDTATPSAAAARDWCWAAARLAQNEPFAALAACDRALDRLKSHSAGNLSRLRLELRELRARSNAAVLRLSEAYQELEEVTVGWRKLGDPQRSAAAAGVPAEFDLRGNRTLGGHSGQLIDTAYDAETGGEGWFWSRLSLLRSAVEQNAPDRVQRIFADTVAALGPQPAPHRQVRLALTMLQGGAEEAVALLTTGLRRIDTAPARLILLTPLRWCDRLPAGVDERSAIAELLGPEPGLDEPHLLLLWAEAMRLLRDDDTAVRTITRACTFWLTYYTPSHDDRDRDYWRWLVLDAAERLGRPALPLPSDVGADVMRFAARSRSTPVLAASALVLCALRGGGERETTAWLDRAERLIAGGGASGSEWEFYLLIAWALSSRDLTTGRARVFADHARQVWQRIRPGRPMPYADRLTEGGGSRPSTDLPLDVGDALGTWSPDQLICRMEATDDGPVLASGGVPRDFAVVFEAVRADAVASHADSLSIRLDRISFALLSASEIPLSYRPIGRDVTIATTSTFLGAIPWEFWAHSRGGLFTRVMTDELVRRHTVMALQRQLRTAMGIPLAVDGLIGPMTWTAATNFLREEGLAARFDAAAWRLLRHLPTIPEMQQEFPEVLVVSDGDIRLLADVVSVYDRAGFAVRRADDTQELAHLIQDIGGRGRLAIVHVLGGFGAIRNNVYIESGSRREPSEPDGETGEDAYPMVSSAAFDRPFASLPPHLPRPMVILDPRRPSGNSETMRQLVCRNAFAHRLLELGNIPVILGIGLEGESLGGNSLRNLFIEQLAAGIPVDEALRELNREISRTDPISRSVALFTHLPPYAMPSWRLRR